MTAELWERIKEVFESALEIQPGERQLFLERTCGSDSTLRSAVSRLLVEYERAGDFLMEPVTGVRQALSPGEFLCDRYRVLELLGSGGMGEVYRVHDSLLNESAALKTLQPELANDEGFLRRFQKEIQLARKVTHTNVCRLYEVGVHEFPTRPPVHFFTMELLEGETLEARIRREGRLSFAEALPWIRQMAAALEAAHQAGIIHGDFKAANVIITDERAVITDFGLARRAFTSLSPNTTSTIAAQSALAGTFAYMSPEQLSGGAITTASDIYSFGIVLYEMATGQLPFDGNHLIQSAVQRATGEVTQVRLLVPDIDPRWEKAIERCLKHNPGERWGSMAEIIEIFRTESPRRLPRWRSLAFRRAGLVLSCLVVILAALFLFISRLSYRGLEEGSAILLAPTINASGEPRFDGIGTALKASLQQSSRFRLWDSGRLNDVLRRMRHKQENELTAADWREVAFRENSPFVVFSTLSRLGGGYVLTVHCETMGAAPDTPVRAWDHTVTAQGPNGLFEAVHATASWIRTTAGESETDVSSHNRLPQDITSSSWEALGSFAEAERLSRTESPAAVTPLFRRAVQLDPQFAMALMGLGDVLISQRNAEEGYGYWREAVAQARSQHLSDHERLSIESRYLLEVGDSASAEPVLREWVSKYPNDPQPSELLVAALISLGRYPEAVTLGREHRRRFGPSLFVTARIFEALAMTGQLDQLEPELNVLRELPAPIWELRFRGAAGAMREDYDSAALAFQQLANEAAGEDASRATSLLAALAAERGDLASAASLLEAGIKHDREAGETGLASQKASALAFIEGVRNNRQSARAWALETTAMIESPQTVMQSVSVLARQGFVKDAERLAARMPYGEGPRYEYMLLRMRGEILAAQGKYDDAIELMERSGRKASSLRPKEYLARVLALSGQDERARLIYSEIVNTPWLIWGSPESEWPGLRLLAKRYLQSRKGE
jgi:serine/threonine protein kinase/tetratricopeptide (TPR) repeat protein